MTSVMQRRGGLFALTASCIILVVSSCTNLTAVREWSATSLQATQYNEIVTTYSHTPERLARYDPEGPYKDDIGIRKSQAEALRQILSIVSDYMAALVTLSADGTVDYKKDVEDLNKTIGKIDMGTSSDTAGAVGSLMKTVLHAAAKGYQAKQVGKIVAQANEPLQKILHGELREIVDQDFRRDLMIEKSLLDRYYDYQLQTGSPSSAARVALREWKDLRLEENNKRLDAVDAYVKVLDKIAAGHNKLYLHRYNLDAKDLIGDLFSLSVEIGKQIRILAES